MHPPAPEDRPDPASWVDRLADRLVRLPGHEAAVWIVPAVLAGLLLVAAAALAGEPLASARLAYALIPAYVLGLIRHLDRTAVRALHELRPALPDDDALVAAFHRRLTTMPARPTLLVTLLFLAIAVADAIAEPVARGVAGLEPAAAVARVAVDAVGIVALGILLWHSLHQGSAIADVQRHAERVDLFRPGPLYAFSAVTLRTGIGLLAVPAFGILTDPAGWRGAGSAIFIVVTLLLASAAFALPLATMRRRILDARARMQAEAGARLRAALAALHARMDAGDEAGVAAADKVVAAAEREWRLLETLPTTPWRSGTLGAFVSALVVPVVLWAITHLLERVV